MTEKYKVTIHSEMGPRDGILKLNYQGKCITGSLDLMGYINTVCGMQAEAETLRLFHPIKTAVSTLSCETVLRLHGGDLCGMTTSNAAHMRWEGILLRQER